MKFFNARVWLIIFGVMGLLGGTTNAIAAESTSPGNHRKSCWSSGHCPRHPRLAPAWFVFIFVLDSASTLEAMVMLANACGCEKVHC